MPPLQRNEQLIVDLLRKYGSGLTRNELIDKSELSRPTVYDIVSLLLAKERIRETPNGGEVASSGGRPSARLVLSRPEGYVVGIDQGHNHVHVGLATLRGVIVDTEPAAIDVASEGATALTKVAELIMAALKAAEASPQDVRAIGIGLPGPVRQGRVASSPFLPSWANVDVARELRAALRTEDRRWETTLPIAVENDANLGAIGERRYGAAKKAQNFGYVKVSTGIGLGLYLGGRLHRGAEGVAGEFGHITTSFDAEEQIRNFSGIALPRQECAACGKLNCLENLAACPAIVAQLQNSDGEYGQNLDIQTVIANARESAIKHPLSRRAVVDAGTRLGHSIADLVRLLDLELVIVGGILAEAEELLSEPINEAVLRAAVGASPVKVELVPPERIRRSEVEGAIGLALEQLDEGHSMGSPAAPEAAAV